MSRIPQVYVPPLGGPLAIQDDESGVMSAAVLAYFNGNASLSQLELVRDWCEYYINAPCWDSNPHHDDETRAELAELRAEVKRCETAEALNAWVQKCLEIGIDPL